MIVCILASAAIIFLPTATLADEAWTTDFGDVTYIADKGDTAIWEESNFDETRRLYFPDLGGNFKDRSNHEGYWIQADSEGCGAVMTGPDGHSGESWGRLLLIFDKRAHPSDWTLLTGSCFEAPDSPMRGTASLSP
jgi:hypothetical protein